MSSTVCLLSYAILLQILDSSCHQQIKASDSVIILELYYDFHKTHTPFCLSFRAAYIQKQKGKGQVSEVLRPPGLPHKQRQGPLSLCFMHLVDWVLSPDLAQLERGSDQDWTGADRAKVNSRGGWAGS